MWSTRISIFIFVCILKICLLCYIHLPFIYISDIVLCVTFLLTLFTHPVTAHSYAVLQYMIVGDIPHHTSPSHAPCDKNPNGLQVSTITPSWISSCTNKHLGYVRIYLGHVLFTHFHQTEIDRGKHSRFSVSLHGYYCCLQFHSEQ